VATLAPCLAALAVVVDHKLTQMRQGHQDKVLLVALALQQWVTVVEEEVLEPQELLVWVQHLLRVQAVLALT
jgi:hypothetical protein